MKVAQLYSDERRRSSREVSLGDDWTSDAIPDARFSLFWIEGTKEVYGLRHGPIAVGPGAPKPYGAYLPVTRQTFTEGQEVTVLGTCATLDELTALLETPEAPRTIEWLRERLAGSG